MERLTYKVERKRGNKWEGGYYTKHNKQQLINALAAYEDTGLSPGQIRVLKERDTAKEAIITGYNRAVGCKVGECPKCGTMARDYMNFCNNCGQRIKWEER